MKLSSQSQSLLADVFQTLVEKFPANSEELAVTDFHFQPLQETGDLVVYDDDDTVLCRVNVVEWCGNAETDSEEDGDISFYDIVQNDLQQAIATADVKGSLQRLGVWKPYSFVLVDEEKETICDLLLVDDDTLIVSDQLLQGLDEELNDFLEHLLGEGGS